MDFVKILGLLVSRFRDRDIPYMVVGAVALGMWGIQRNTRDLDFLIRATDKDSVDGIMSAEEYTVSNRSDAFVQYEHFLAVYGIVDYLISHSPIGDTMIARAVEKDVGGDFGKVRIATLEDIVILKLLAIKNNPKRPLDRDDVKTVIAYYGDTLDWPYIEEYSGMLDIKEALEDVRKDL